MVKTRVLIVSLIMMFGLLSGIMTVSARNNIESSLITNDITVRKGQETEFIFSLDGYDDTEIGINSIKGTLEYDPNIFENPTQENFEPQESWENIYYNPDNKQFVLISRTNNLAGGAVMHIKLTAKATLPAKDTYVGVSGLSVSGGKEDIFPNGVTVKISAISDNPPINSETNAEGEQTGAENNMVEEELTHQESKQDTVAQTGDDFAWKTAFFLCTASAVLMITSLVAIKKKKGYTGGVKILTSAVIIAVLATVTGSVYVFSGKGDLNGDGAVDYTDVQMLQKHLISMELLPESKRNIADMSSDGKLTVTDLSLLIQKIEKTVNYDVKITSMMDKFYYEKNDEFLWSFYADVSYGAEIKRITINNTEYEVQKAEGNPEYSVRLKAGNVSGIQEFHITKVSLNSGQEVSINHTEKIDVLKAEPSVDNFITEELSDTAQMKVSFTLKDEDSAITSSKMEILKNTDGEFVLLDVKEISVGENEFILDLEEDTVYTLNISAQYNRDSNELEVEGDNRGSLSFIKEIELNIDYRFSFENMKVETKDGVETNKFNKNQPFVLKFESSNSTKFKPDRVMVNNVIYQVENSGGEYYITIDGFTQIGETEIRIDKVILENGKVFSLDNNNIITVMILKEKPTITEFSATEDAQKAQFNISFILTDPDNALSNGKIHIKNAVGKIVGSQLFESKNLNSDIFNGIIALTDTELTSSYMVQIIADCDISTDGSEIESQKILVEQEIKAQPKAVITSARAGETYIEKGSDIDLYYEISDNVGSELEKLVVNNVELTAETLKSNTWKVTSVASQKSGEQKFILSQLVFNDGTIVNVNHEISVEIMKSAPEIREYNTEDIIESDQIKFSFDVIDEDNSFLSGKIQLIPNDGISAEIEETIAHTGKQEFTLDAEERKEYTFKVILSWRKSEDGSIVVSDDIVLEKTVYMVRDYGLKLSNMKTSSEDGTDKVYYEPDSAFKVSFKAETSTALVAKKAHMNGDVYNLTSPEANFYEFTADAGSQAGVKNLTIDKIVMENEKELSVDNDNSVRIEVLKAIPEVENFTSEKTSQDKLRVQFVLKDTDGTIQNAQVQIVEEGGGTILTQEVFVGNNDVVSELTANEHYTVKITADFDRDTNTLDDQSNYYQGEQIYMTSISVSLDAIQFKDITNTTLYRSEGNITQKVDVLDITGDLPKDVENYYAIIEMEGMPDFYTGIKEFRKDADSGKVYAVIDQEDTVFYDKNGIRQNEYAFPVVFRDNEGEHPLVKSAEELFREMSARPNESYELTENLDASNISTDAAAIAGTFTGKLNGNGYKILNLKTSLFQTLSNANIHNLIIDNAQITTSRSGILANVIQNQSVIENVFIVDSSISNGVDELGAFAGNLNNSTIQESASINVSVKGLVAVGGIVGKTNSGSIIENCYVTGKVQGTYDHPSLGARVGGIAGWHGGGIIKYCFTQVQVIAPAKKGNGGLIGGPNTGSPVIENCLSISTGAGYRIAGFDVLENAKNVYEYSGSNSETNITEENQSQVKETDNIFEKSFYVDDLGFNRDIWELDLLVYGKRPNLKDAPEVDNNYGIPDYTQLQNDENYKPEREQAYANMAKLMPFSDIRTWVEHGNRLSDEDILAVQAIRFVLPLDANGSLVPGIHNNSLNDIEKIRIVFEKAKMQEYKVSFQKTMGNIIAVYQIDGIDIRYQFHGYISAIDESLIEDVVNIVSNYDYTADIAIITDEDESRLYKDYYNETVKNDIKGVITKLIFSQGNYPTYCENQAVQKMVNERIKDEDTLKKLLYAYNYYDKWYHIDYNGVTLSELLFFNGELVAQSMTATELTEKLLAVGSNQRETHRTVTFYNNVLQNYIGEPLMDFLGNMSYSIAGYDNPSDWFADNFDGILKEQEPYGEANGMKYRIWDILCGLDDGRKSIILPIMTAPQTDMYLISLPSQLIIGSMNRYNTYLNKDGNERQRMRDIIDIYAEKMGIFYGVSSTWMSSSIKQLNSFVNIQYDTRLNFPQSDAADAGDQDKDKTRDPVMKWVYEANNTISAKNGSAASADGTNVYWMIDAALGTSDYSFFTFSHETAHNQDGRYFYSGAGRRKGTGGEAHADGNIAQEMRDGCMVFNISKINDIGVEMTNNFSYERINSADKIKSYYSEMFETGYVLDYLAAQAFLRLTAEQQAAVAVQANHTAGGSSSFSTVYSDISVEALNQMNLDDIDDLWENKISIRNIKKGSEEKVNTATDGSYGFESFYNMNWYQSHNDSGSPDTHSFKRLGMEMLGFGGYEGGYMIYMSALSENDLDALRKISGDSNITWKEYKMNRFKAVKEKLNSIPYFDTETVIEQFKSAFEKDAQNGTRSESIAVKRMIYGMIKRVTGDFSDGGIYESPKVISVTSAEDLIHLTNENPYGYYRLDDNLDFSGITAEQGSYISNRFIGILDGGGYKMTGMQYPLFGDLQYAQVKNLTISQSSYNAGAQAILAIKTKQVIVGNVTVDNITAEGINTPLPLVKTKSDVYYEYGTINIEESDTYYEFEEANIMGSDDYYEFEAGNSEENTNYIFENEVIVTDENNPSLNSESEK